MENTVCRTKQEVLELKKWLRLILVFSIAHLALTYGIPNDSIHKWRTWVFYGINAASLYCFFHLMKHNHFYGFAVICMIVELVTSVASHLATTVFFEDLINFLCKVNPDYELYSSYSYISVVTTPLSIIGVIASFLGYIWELNAHSAITAAYDTKLAKQWKQLFFLNLGAGLLASALGHLFMYLHEALVWDFTVYQRIYPVVNLPVTAVKILYMFYLWRTIQVITVKEADA